jgi:hypothetical protein
MRTFAPSAALIWSACLGLGVCAGSCTPQADPSETSVAAARFSPAAPPIWGDDDNSPVIKGWSFWELHLGGLPNDAGFEYTGFVAPNGTPLELDIRDARMVGLDSNGQVVLDTPGMTGAKILVTRKSETFSLVVVEIDSVPFWAGDTSQRATAYQFRVSDPREGTLEDLCKKPPSSVDWPGSNVRAAILFSGERYPDPGTVITGPTTDRWVNLACAGTAIGKMHLVRHTESSADPNFPTTPEQRQAMLRMYTSAVCGKKAYTFRGEPIRYVDALKFVNKFDNVDTIEAIWKSEGAVCLTVHRLQTSMFSGAPDRLKELQNECPSLPSCWTLPGFPDSWSQHGLVLSANPSGS